jgi:hypothetical protein
MESLGFVLMEDMAPVYNSSSKESHRFCKSVQTNSPLNISRIGPIDDCFIYPCILNPTSSNLSFALKSAILR